MEEGVTRWVNLTLLPRSKVMCHSSGITSVCRRKTAWESIYDKVLIFYENSINDTYKALTVKNFLSIAGEKYSTINFVLFS